MTALSSLGPHRVSGPTASLCSSHQASAPSAPVGNEGRSQGTALHLHDLGVQRASDEPPPVPFSPGRKKVSPSLVQKFFRSTPRDIAQSFPQKHFCLAETHLLPSQGTGGINFAF